MKTYSNLAENTFARYAESRGWHVTKRGWPDFFCFKDDGEIAVVEVKPSDNYMLKKEQLMVLEALMLKGIRTYVWTPGKGIRNFKDVLDWQRVKRARRSNGREYPSVV